MKYLLTNKKFILFNIVILSFLIRYLYLDKSNFSSVQGGDQTIYLQLADNLARDGIYIMEPGLRSFFPPMHPWLMAQVIKLFGKSIPHLYIFYFIMSSCTVLIFFAIARNLWGDTIALITSTLFMIYAEFIYWTTHLYTETPFIFFSTLTIFFILKYTQTQKVIHLILSALFFSATFYTRSTIATLLPFILIHIYLNFAPTTNILKKILIPTLYCLIIFLILLPWGIRNYKIHKKFFLTSTNGGMNFLQGNNDWAHGEKTLPPQLFPGPNYHQRPTMSEVEQDEYFYREGIKWIKADLVRFMKLVLNKWKYMLIYKVDKYSYEDKVSPIGRKMFFLINWPPILLLGLVGIFFTFKEWKKISIFYGCIIATFITNGLYYPAQRYRLIMDIVMLLWSAVGIYYITKYILITVLPKYFKNINLNSLLNLKLNNLGLNEIFDSKIAMLIKFTFIILILLLLIYQFFGMRFATILKLNRGDYLTFDPRQWKSGPSKMEGDCIFFPWPSLLREKIYLPRGKYIMTIKADGDEYEGAKARFRININGEDIKTILLENSVGDYDIYFDWKGGEAPIIIYFDRSKEETASIYSIKIKKL